MLRNSFLLFAAVCCAVATLSAETVTGVLKSYDRPAGLITLERSDTKAVITGFGLSGDMTPERVGTLVRADYLPVGDDGKRFRFDRLVPADPAGERELRIAAERLRAETRERGRRATRELGDNLPAFALRDQYGRVVTNADLRGKFVVVSFIFTHCRMDEMCPASTRKMVELSERLKKDGVENVVFLSISFDPERDTPGALKDYGDAYKADHAKHRFLTGPKDAIDDLRRQFGILTVNEETGDIVHNVATTLVSPAGRILFRSDSPRWTVDSFAERVAKQRTPINR